MPLFLVVTTSAIVSYMGYRHVSYRYYREFRIQLLVLGSEKYIYTTVEVHASVACKVSHKFEGFTANV